MSSILERSRDLIATGQVDEAVLLLTAERTASTDQRVPVMLVGYALYHAGRLGDARAALAEGLQRFPLDPALHEAMARIRWMDGDGEAFADQFIAAVKQQPGNGVLRSKCAELLRQSGALVAAEQMLREGLSLEPNDLSFQSALGVLLDETGRLEEAEAVLRQALSRSPGDPITLLNFSHVQLRAGNTDAALRILRGLRRTYPSMQAAIAYEGMALKQAVDPAHDWLLDYHRHVQVHQIGTPRGFSGVAEFNRALATHLRGMMKAKERPLEQSVRGGTQTGRNLVVERDETLQAFFAALEEPLRAYANALGEDARHPVAAYRKAGHGISSAWSVLLKTGGYQVSHLHPSGWVSATYFVSVPAGIGPDSQQGWLRFGEPRLPVPGCSVERAVQPQEGMLALFPSYMWAGTTPVPTGEHLTVGFDVVTR
ncbi:MAG: tetratricopeptide repeat protein [Hyphomonadaceae bacterium]